tara:strand:+ start:86 stop:367 length:282 start_codon:yes stop_codon:yes gene_type:complete
MPGLGRTVLDMGGGGLIMGPGSFTTFCDSQKVSLVGDGLATHGEPPHTSGSSLIGNGSATVFCESKPVTVATISIATCAHPITPGSPTVFVGG